MPLPRTRSHVVAADQRDVGDRDDAAAGVAAGVAEGAQLFEVPVAGVEAGFGLQGASGGGVEGLLGADQDAGQGRACRRRRARRGGPAGPASGPRWRRLAAG